VTDAAFLRPALSSLVPYEPGKPVEEVQRELGVERVVKLASNEGTYGPIPAAVAALERSLAQLNRYPDGGAYRLRSAIASLHGVAFEEVAVGAGADGVVDGLSQAVLEPGDDVVCGWPSFPSYVIDALKAGAGATKVPLRDHRYDLDALLAAVTQRTKIVYLCVPNNPTGTSNSRDELDAYFAHVPPHVLTVLDQAYLEYIDDPDYPDGVAEYFKQGRRVLVLRTFSKIYGLAGLRVGYAIASREIVAALAKVRRAFDISTPAQEAALASIDCFDELARRRAANAAGRRELESILRKHDLDPAGPAVANFVYTEVDGDAQMLFDALLHEGVIIRPLAGFGAPSAVRITVGTPADHQVLDAALGRVRAKAGAA
jgi:histidinol-phosphate aminotransferase